jgi:hypothetical protein
MAARGKDIGEPVRGWEYHTGLRRYLVPYQRGAISFRWSDLEAFGLDGATWRYWERRRTLDPAFDARLGCVTSDEMDTYITGGFKSYFETGAIFSHPPAYGVHTVSQPILAYYEDRTLAPATGLPIEEENSITARGTQGSMQIMSEGAWFLPAGQTPKFLTRPIWTEFQATGGVRVWGYPTRSVYHVAGETPEVQYAETNFSKWFAFMTAGQRRAREVHGQILEKYNSLGGRRGVLGLPLTSEIDIPGTSSARMNEFEHGAICLFGSPDQTVVVRPFRFRVTKLKNHDPDPLFEMDPYIFATIKINDQVILDNERHPSSGHWESDTVYPYVTLAPLIAPRVNDTITLIIEVWDSRLLGDYRHRTWIKHLTAATAWGLKENGGSLVSEPEQEPPGITGTLIWIDIMPLNP